MIEVEEEVEIPETIVQMEETIDIHLDQDSIEEIKLKSLKAQDLVNNLLIRLRSQIDFQILVSKIC